LVDSETQVIVHAQAFGDGQDLYVIPPVLYGAVENMQLIGCGEEYFAGKTFTADSAYHSPSNLKKCEEVGLDAYLPDKRFRKRDPRFQGGDGKRDTRVDKLTLADFERTEARDQYLCPHRKVFRLQVREVVIDGVIYRRYVKDTDG